MKHIIKVLILIAALALFATEAFAVWSAGSDRDGAYVRNGSVIIPMGNIKIANKTAKALNKEEKKAEKRASNSGDDDKG
jgi:hypothetical protein